MLASGTRRFDLRGGIGSGGGVVVVELCFGLSPESERGGGTEKGREAEKNGVRKFGD